MHRIFKSIKLLSHDIRTTIHDTKSFILPDIKLLSIPKYPIYLLPPASENFGSNFGSKSFKSISI